MALRASTGWSLGSLVTFLQSQVPSAHNLEWHSFRDASSV